MICSKCGKENLTNAEICSNCGNPLNNNQTINTTTNNSNITKKINSFDKKQKLIIGGLGILIIVLAIIAIGFYGTGAGNTRTVMIYIVGSNLETDGEIVTADLAAIKPENIDLSKTNILLYTGGTKKWHNFISNTDNGIYILKSKGFEKLESQKQYSLGDPSTLTNFIKYAYDNYKASKYDLILYNHGGAIDGAIYDDLSSDNLSLQDMVKALDDSPFNEKNKLDAVLFRTCLNGTIELANIFKPYAKYLIGSEEVSWGSKVSNVLGFLNGVTNQDGGQEFGIKFIGSYKNQMSVIDPFGTAKYTYSVIDLSKIDKVNAALDEYISGIDISKNYYDIVRIRTEVYQYGLDNASFDMIDLYNFVEKTSQYSTKDGKNLLNAITEAVKYNASNESASHGLSIYFPYNGTKGLKYKYLKEVYTHLNYSNNYKNFIETFTTTRTNTKPFSFTLTDSSVVNTEKDNELELQLTEDQKNNYAFSTFTIFEQDKEHPNYYRPIFNSNDTTLDDKGILKIDYKNKLTKVKDDETGKYQYALTYHRKNGNLRFIYGTLYDTDLTFTDDGYMIGTTLYLTDNNGKLVISTAKLRSDNERIDGILLDLKEYEEYEIWTTTYRILDSKGNVMNSSEWETAPVYTGYGGKVKEFELEYANLDNNGNYYGLFIITDMSGNASYSKLIKIGE